MDDVQRYRIIIDATRAVDGGREAQRALEKIEASVSQVSRAMSGLESTMRSLFAGFLGMQGVRMLAQTADAFTQLTNSLKVAGVAGADLTLVQDRLFQAANKNGVEIGALGQTYSRLTMSAKELGATQDQMLKFVDGVTAAMRIQGGSTQEASGALLQLSQAMGAGIVRAEEFNSVLEGALPIAQAAARGIDGMGGSIAKLRTAVNDGKVTSQDFFKGLLKGFAETEAQAEKSTLTLSAGLTTVTNSWTRFIGELDQTLGASQTAVSGLANLSKALGDVASQLERGRESGKGFWATVLQDQRAQTAAERQAKGQSVPMWLRPQAEQDAYKLQELQKERDAQWNPDSKAFVQAQIDKLKRDQQIDMAADEDWARRYKLPVSQPPAPPTPTGKGGGESPDEKLRKYMSELRTAAEAQDAFTKAMGTSDAELIKATIHFEAVAKSADFFGERLKDGDARLVALEKAMGRVEFAKLHAGFVSATKELEKQNEVLAAQISLFGQAPDIQAKELALIKAKQEALKAGEPLEGEAFKQRVAALEVGEKLKIQYAELQKASELWTAPIKQALEDIQRIGADAWDKFLENGKWSFDELSKVFTATLRRMAAEFLTLATVRPVMSVLVNAISPSMAQSMGLGGSSTAGGGGGFSMPSWMGGGSLSGWLGSPISGNLPSTMYGPPAPGQSMSSGFLGDITWGQGLGALAGAGMGIFQLMNSKTTSGTIGGISSILGAGLSLIPGVGPILGPAVGLLGNLIPGLFGMDKPPTITNQTYGQLQYGSGGWFTSGGAWGPNADAATAQGPLATVGNNISAVFKLLGGVKNAGSVWGGSTESKSVSGQGWQSDSTSSFLVDPSGNRQLWRMNEGNMMDTLSAQIAYRSILGGATGDISENMRTALTKTGQTMGGTSLQAIAETIAEVLAFDKAIEGLGKTVSDAEKAVKAVDDAYASLYATADKYGLPVADLDAAKARDRLGVATDFGKSISRQILEMTDPKAAAIADLDDWRATMIKNNQYLLDNVTGALDQINEIEKLYGMRRAAIVEQNAQASLQGLADVIKRLTYGDLSGASPGATLSGLQGSYSAMLAQANAGSATAVAGLGGAAANLAQYAGSYYGTATPAYQALVGGLRSDLSGVYLAQGGNASDLAGILTSTNTGIATMSAQLADIAHTLEAGGAADEELKETLTELLGYMRRVAAKIAA